MSNSVDVLRLDVESARRERDEMREECERMKDELHLLAGKMVYRGNSIAYIHSKAENYGAALIRAWAAFTKISGVRPGSPIDDAILEWGGKVADLIDAAEAYAKAEEDLGNWEINGINRESWDRLNSRVHATYRDLEGAIASVRGEV